MILEVWYALSCFHEMVRDQFSLSEIRVSGLIVPPSPSPGMSDWLAVQEGGKWALYDGDGELGDCKTDFLVDLKDCCIDSEVMFANFHVSCIDTDGERRQCGAPLWDSVPEIGYDTEGCCLCAFGRDGAECGDVECVTSPSNGSTRSR